MSRDLKVLMTPHVSDFGHAGSGIRTVVEKYFRYLPDFGIELVPPKAASYDVWAIHAGMTNAFAPNDPIVLMCHGLYWSADYEAEPWELQGNREVVHVVRHAQRITVPSAWVAEAFARDMHLWPAVIPHGVDADEWAGGDEGNYVLWNKNRATDACSPEAVNELAARAPDTLFLSTFSNPRPTPNVRVTGPVPPEEMRRMVLGCSIYLATAKETFGIGTLEAMAAGKPVLGFRYGGTAELIEHGVTGYLAEPGNYDDLLEGLRYCKRYRKALGKNAAEAARQYTWQNACRLVAAEYARTVEQTQRPPVVAVVIPCYNKAATLYRAVESVLKQTQRPNHIVVVDNNSEDDYGAVLTRITNDWGGVPELRWIGCQEQGVAYARNAGIAAVPDADYIVCLDADDALEPTFVEVCARALRADNSLALAYTRMRVVAPDGAETISQWPGHYKFDDFLVRKNPVPTCNMFRRVFWERLGGYRQRYAPKGAGAEDVEFWLRMGAAGGRGQLVTQEPLFVYYLGGAVSGNPDYREADWLSDKPWALDGQHPFASLASPANGISHLVRQVDEPLVSIIVPVGPGHAQYLTDILDSIEAQTFRKWECIVVNNTLNAAEDAAIHSLSTAYPFVRGMVSAVPGAGIARNLGASFARAPFLLFVDADDWLAKDALATMVAAYHRDPEHIIYSDYWGYAYIGEEATLNRLERADRLAHHDPATKRTVVRYYAADYDCARAVTQPMAGSDPYIWNVISSLVPKAYHDEIGGFDEKMESWEDWDYWLRMARAGKCFARVAEPLLHYRFYSGYRRALANPGESGESGRQLSAKLLDYMTDKYQRSTAMPGCRSCGGGSRRSTPPPSPLMTMDSQSAGRMSTMSASDLVEVELIDGNYGEHLIAFNRQSYGYRKHGERFKMSAEHARLDRRVRIVENEAVAAPTPVAPASLKAAPPPPPNAEVDEPQRVAPQAVAAPPAPANKEIVIKPNAYPFRDLWGIDEEREQILINAGVRSLDGLRKIEPGRLAQMLDVTESTAKGILSRLEAAKK